MPRLHPESGAEAVEFAREPVMNPIRTIALIVDRPAREYPREHPEVAKAGVPAGRARM